MRDAPAGAVMALLTNDAAAGVLVAQSGNLFVQAFCLTCGAIWLPAQEILVNAFRGERGETARQWARVRLEEMVKRGRGFKLVSEEDRRMAEWASSVLSSVDTLIR